MTKSESATYSDEAKLTTSTLAKIANYQFGTEWLLLKSRVRVIQQVSPEMVLVRDLDTGQAKEVSTSELDAISDSGRANSLRIDLEDFSEEQWTEARRREVAVRERLSLGAGRIDASGIESLASQLNISARHLRRQLDLFYELGTTAAFLPRRTGPRKGSTYLNSRVERLIAEQIAEALNTSPDIGAEDVWFLIDLECSKLKLKSPGQATVGRRLAQAKRQRDLLDPSVGRKLKYEERQVKGAIQTFGPLDTLEIDHTIVDVHVIEPKTGRSLGRPVLTIIICRATRVIHGMLLTFEAPSRLSVALALHHAVFPKHAWLEAIGLPEGCWPGYGLLKNLLSDNAAEFRAASQLRGAQLYGINLKFRDPGDPADGGIVERAIGTLMKKVRLLPGRSYSDLLGATPRHASKSARMTLSEVQLYLAREISRYHKRRHSGIGMPPVEAWDQAWATGGSGPRFPRVPENSLNFLMGFLPGKWRTVTREGIELFGLRYQSRELLPYITAKKKWMVRYDPRDLGCVFLEVDSGHIALPGRQFGGESFSLWEWDAYRAQKRALGQHRDPQAISAELAVNRELVKEAASRSTKQALPRLVARQEAWKCDSIVANVKAQLAIDPTMRLVWKDL